VIYSFFFSALGLLFSDTVRHALCFPIHTSRCQTSLALPFTLAPSEGTAVFPSSGSIAPRCKRLCTVSLTSMVSTLPARLCFI
jgi:hypothetical protein